MFTGLIEEIGVVQSLHRSGSGIYLTISSQCVISGTQVGDSITLDGTCQTVTELGESSFTVFASRVTCDLTTLGNFQIGRRVNLERALSPTSRIGGHIVQGHIDGKGKVKSITKDGDGMSIEISVWDDIFKYIVEKGSVAVDGISLTVVSITDSSFHIYIIPETVNKTTLSEKMPGDEVNIEVDILAKYIEKMLIGRMEVDKDKILKKKLIEEGFI